MSCSAEFSVKKRFITSGPETEGHDTEDIS